MRERRLLLIIGGGIAAYKCLELIRRARERGFSVRTVMTKAAEAFVTPLSVSAISNERVLTELFDVDEEREIGHIRLSREADLIVVAPATADLMARMAGGHADDLATAVLLATAGDDHGARPIPQQPRDVDPARDVVQPQLHELGPLLHEVPMLGLHVLMTATTNGDADH